MQLTKEQLKRIFSLYEGFGWQPGMLPPEITTVDDDRTGQTIAVRHLADRDLEELRRALARTLRELRLGSPASQIVGRLNQLTRAEQRRRERRRCSRPDAA